MKKVYLTLAIFASALAICAFIAPEAALAVIHGVTSAHNDHGMVLHVAEGAAAVTIKDLEAVSDKLKEVTAKFNAKGDELSKTAEAAMAEVKDKGKLLDETKAKVDQMLLEHTALTKDRNDLQAKLSETEARLAGVEMEVARRPGGEDVIGHKTIGQRLIEDEKIKTFAANGSGAIGRSDKLRFSTKAAITSTNFPVTTPSINAPERLPGVLPRLAQRLFVRDLLDVGQTQSPAIFYVKQTGFTNNAAVVSEGTLKPTSTIAYTSVMTPVTTIAHLFKASKQIMDDFQQLKTDVDREMRYGLKYAEEQEVLLGDGHGIHLTGIVPQASAFSPAFTPEMPNRIDSIRLAILQSQLARLPATGIVMHFTDEARIDLTKDSNGQYLFSNPLRAAGANTLWGLPVVPTEISSFQQHFLVGAFRGAAQIYDREEMGVEIATENNDDFEKNMLTIRCEERVALAVFRPEAFIYGTFQATT